MDVVLPTTALTVALGSILLVVSIAYTLQKIVKNARKDRALREAKLLQAAKEEDAKIKKEFESRLEKLELQIKHMKETYAAEVKVLGEKIEDLRQELRDQHSQMVSLLSELIKNRE